MSLLLLLQQAATATVLAPVNVSLAVGGTATVSYSLTATSEWTNSPTSFSYQWQRSTDGGTTWTNIPGATTQFYTLAAADQGYLVRLNLTATNAAGSTTATSNAVGPVAAAIVALTNFAARPPVLTAELDFVGGPLGINSIWTDVSSDVRGQVTISRGRSNPLDRIEVGQASTQVDNSTRKYEPEFAGSPFYPNIVPRVGFRLRAVYNGTIYPLHRGLVQSWPITWPQIKRSYASITSADSFGMLNDAKVTPQIFAAALSGRQIATFLDQAGFPTTLRLLDPGEEMLLGVDATQDFSDPPDVLTLVQDSADSELGLFFIGPDGAAVFHDRDHRISATRSSVTQATFSDDPNQGLPYISPEPEYGIERVYNDVRVTSGITNALPQIALDQASINRFGRRTLSRTTRLSTDAAASSQAQRILSDSKDPHLRFPTITIDPTRDARLWPVVLGLEISDRVLIYRNPYAGGTAIQKLCWVESIRHDIRYDPTGVGWTTTLALSLADPSIYFVLDSTTKGILDTSQLR